MNLKFVRHHDKPAFICCGIEPQDYSGEVIIPAEHEGLPVIAINTGAFRHADITAIHIPSTVTCIEAEAFQGCASLRQVTFDDDSQLQDVESFAFSACTAGLTIRFPESLQEVSHFAFSNSLVDLLFPSTCTIADFAFDDAKGRAHSYKVQLSPYPVETDEHGNELQLNKEGTGYIFLRCKMVDRWNAYAPETFKGLPITEIGNRAFENCISHYISIPATVVKCGSFIFYGCDNLWSVSFGGTSEQWKKLDVYVWEDVDVCCNDNDTST